LSLLPLIVEAAANSRESRDSEDCAIERTDDKPANTTSPTQEPGAWIAALWQKHSPGLLLYARQKSSAAEDLVQTAFLSLARLAEPPRDPVTWLYRVVRNGAVSHWRQEQRRQRREQAVAEERGEWFQPTQQAALDQAELREALSRLESAEREVVVLHIWGGLTFVQLGEVLETSSSTAQRQYAAALARLKMILEGNPR